MSENKTEEFSKLLKKHGFSDPKWVSLFTENNVADVGDIFPENKATLFNALRPHATNDDELRALRQVLNMENSEFEGKLEACGLNHLSWAPRFEEIGVSTVHQLHLLEGDSKTYFELEQFAKFNIEKKALWTLLKMDEVEEKAKARRKERTEKAKKKKVELQEKCKEQEEKRKQLIKQRKEEVSKLLSELKSDTKSRSCEKIEAELQNAMGIQSDSWKSHGISSSDIDKLEANIDKYFAGGMEITNENFSDDVLIQFASGGLALQGILISKNLDDQLQPRDCLLQISEHARFAGPTISPVEDFEDFTSKEMEDKHKLSVSTFGCSLKAATKFPAYAGAVHVEASSVSGLSTESKRTNEKHQEITYCSRVKHCMIPMRSYSFQLRDIEFSSNAIEDLELIESFLIKYGSNSEVVQQKCEHFFNNYGSHVSRGPIHFGGIYWWTCSSKNVHKKELSIVKDLHSEALNTKSSVTTISIGGSAEVDIEHVKGKHKRKCSSNALSTTCLVITKTGGPAIISNLPDWKKGLQASNSTWSVIDRSQRFTPIWNVIELNYSGEFAQVKSLVKVLRKAWEKMTGLHIKTCELRSDVLEDVSKWCKDRRVDSIEEHLQQLIEVREELLEKTGDANSWGSQYLSNTVIQQFLLSIIENIERGTQLSPHAMFQLRQLISQRELKKISSKKVQEKIQDMLYGTTPRSSGHEKELECGTFESLITLLDRAKEMILLEGKDKEATVFAAKAINTLRSHFDDQHMYDDLFILTLILPFARGSTEQVMINTLSQSDIEGLAVQLKEEYYNKFRKYEGISNLHLQAYLFNLTVSMYHNNSNMSEIRVIKHLQCIEKRIGNNLEGHIVTILSCHLSASNVSDWRKFHTDLESLLQSETPPISPTNSTMSLSQILKEPTSVPLHVDDPIEEQEHEVSEAYQFFMKLDLLKFHPQKLGLRHCIAIKHKDLETDHCTDPKCLPLLILHKMMTYDTNCRKVLLKEEISQITSNDSDDTFSDDDMQSSDDESTAISVHPQDALFAVLYCANNFIRQDLLSRLATCQFALPFIYSDPFNHQLTQILWGLKSIVKEWKTSDVSVECPLTSYPMPIIVFLRFNKYEKSKSKILNSIVSHSNYDHFFHRDCEGGSMPQLFGDGYVDICWYLPTGKANDTFLNSVAFLNVHGDARNHKSQMAYLSKISSMCFILLKDEDIDDEGIDVIKQFSTIPGGIVLLRLNDGHLSKELKQKLKESIENVSSVLQSTALGKSNADLTKTKIVSKIREKWKTFSKAMRSIEDWTVHAPSSDIKLDISMQIRTASKLASDFQEVIESVPAGDVKETMLPLQGEKYWQAWAQLDRVQHEQVDSDIAIIDGRKKALRKVQFQVAEKLTPLMEKFLSSIFNCERSIRVYYLQCLKLYLDNHSRKLIRQLNQQHEASLLQCQSSRDKQVNKAKYYKSLNRASFGLEHVLREVGQVYEAAQHHDLQHCQQLPRIAAELLIDGYPLELLDGDAAHVQLAWIKAVLDEVIKLLKDPQVFVLSVLGLQSSGKSTLINTTFGLQFTVSAGRCTRGAFMQLLPVSDKLREELHCDYLLIVDTEGLRAPELESKQRIKADNKLATFAIGLANVTMINIYGEVPGEMDDILQTVIHAFIHMKRVKLKPSCQFVHQNVPAISALGKGEMGRYMFRDKLDKVTVEIAQAEDCSERFTCFSDVIRFDTEKDVHHFPGLWNGVPPMASINQGYCDKARELRKRIVDVMNTKDNALSSFKQRLEDLWNGLLHENFVLSFRNSLEAIAFKSLEAEYGKWTWKLKCEILKWNEQSKSEISNSDIQELTRIQRKLFTGLNELANSVHLALNNQMKVFFKKHKHGDLLEPHEAHTVEKLDTLKQSLVLQAKKQCEQAIRIKKANLDVDGIKSKYDAKLKTELAFLAEKLKETQYDSHTLQRQFDIEWMTKIQELHTECEPILQLQVDVASAIETALTAEFLAYAQALRAKLRKKKLIDWGSCLRIDLVQDVHYELSDSTTGWISKAKIYANWIKSPAEYYKNRLEFAANLVLQSVEQYLKTIKDEVFNPILADKLITTLRNGIHRMKNNDKYSSWMNNVKLLDDFKLDMFLVACGYALHAFEKMAKDYSRKHDPVEYFKEKKEFYFMYFQSLHSRAAADVAAASSFCHLLTKPIRESVMTSLGPAIVNDMKSAHKYLQTKSTLKAQILIDLAECIQKESGEFERFACYLQCPQVSIFNWLRQYTILHCDKSKSGGMTCIAFIAIEKLSELILLISKMIKSVTRKIPKQDNLMDGNDWLFLLCTDDEMKRTLTLDFSALQNFKQFESLNAESFLRQVMEGLESIENRLQEEFRKMDVEIVEELPQPPHVMLYESLQGCSELCPFCNEECERDFKHTDNHSITQHRPQCLAGSSMNVSDKMVMDICNVMVGSNKTFKPPEDDNWHQFKEFNTVYPSWFIQHDRSYEASSYWKWLLGNYASMIAEYFDIKVADIPPAWKELKWADVKESLMKNALPD